MMKRILLCLLAIGVLSSLGVFTGLGVFTDTASVGSNDFTTGTVDISTAPTSALVSFTNMAPGDSITDDITVTNPGSLALRYAVTSTTTENTLAAQLDLTIWDEAVEADAGTLCNATAPATVLYGPADLGNTTAINVIGSPTQGAQAGDRPVAASANEVLCFRVALPLTTGNAYQNLTTTATFAFQAEQTANN
jgi:hypothetical protein